MAIKKILVTGSSGLVGSAFKKIQNEFNYTFVFITSNDCNLEVYSETKACFQKHKPDYIIHLAACVGGLYKNMNYKVDMLEKNLLMNFNVVKCSYEIGVEKLICMLSTCIFPDSTTYPINENMLHDGPPHFSNDAYSYAKRMMEVHCKAYNENYNTNYSCIIPTNIYGSNDNISWNNARLVIRGVSLNTGNSNTNIVLQPIVIQCTSGNVYTQGTFTVTDNGSNRGYSTWVSPWFNTNIVSDAQAIGIKVLSINGVSTGNVRIGTSYLQFRS